MSRYVRHLLGISSRGHWDLRLSAFSPEHIIFLLNPRPPELPVPPRPETSESSLDVCPHPSLCPSHTQLVTSHLWTSLHLPHSLPDPLPLLWFRCMGFLTLLPVMILALFSDASFSIQLCEQTVKSIVRIVTLLCSKICNLPITLPLACN